ncbi:MAG: acylphosphatase [Candidatus Cloacimonetes bacterium]|nr:acylphosphatase [Candidatus Cloacimonadota bacterium]
MKKLEIIISGRVQGVGYRFFVVHIAHSLNIRGSVKNTFSGKVKIIAVGEENDLNLFIAELRKGPMMARIDKVKVSELHSAKGYESFSIEY